MLFKVGFSTNLFYKSLIIICAVLIVTPIIGFVDTYSWIYRLTCFCLSIFVLLPKRNVKFNVKVLFLLLSCLISILVNDIPSLFRPWERFFLFITVMLAFSPLIQTAKLNYFRSMLFDSILIIILILSFLSFFCFFLGINYMHKELGLFDVTKVGRFAGLFNHSMVLGPMSAISSVYILAEMLKVKNNRRKMVFITLFISVIGSLLMSASRGAFVSAVMGVLFVIYCYYRTKLKQLIKKGFCVIFIIVLTFPSWSYLTQGMLEKQKNNVETGSTFMSREGKWDARMAEFLSSPLFGIGFCSVDIKRDNYSMEGVIEPGTSYGAVLSMTGLLGFFALLLLLSDCFHILKKNLLNNYDSIMYGAVFIVISCYYIVEGNIFSAGSFLCLFYWLSMERIYSLKYKAVKPLNRSLCIQS